MTVPYAAALNPAQVTVEAWAYPTGGQGTFRSVVTSRDYAPGNARGYILYASSSNTWQLWLGNGDWVVVYGPPIVLNQWAHLVGTYDGTTARLYVNGALAASSGASGFLQNAVRPLRIASGATDKTAPQYSTRLAASTRSPSTAALSPRRACRRTTWQRVNGSAVLLELVSEALDVLGEGSAHKVDSVGCVVALVSRPLG